jgi:3-hydroxyisobutyrate dehydrogenase
MSKPQIAFLGLGIMGSGMARRLLVHGFPLSVFNRNPEKSKPFAAEGAHAAGSPREAAAPADVIISMVADDNASLSLWLGENGALAAAKPGTVCIECSTVSLNWVGELSAAATARGCAFLDAPVTGSKIHAASGELTFLVGGDAIALQKAQAVLAAMSKAVIHLGPTGSGAMMKLVNNFLCGVQVAALAEAVALIERSGLDRAKALDILTNGAPGSPLVKTVAARMSAPEAAPHFLLRLMAKDLGFAIAEGAKLSLPLLTATAALELFQRAAAAGHGEKDMSAIIAPLR